MTYLPENSWWLIISILVWLLISITETAFVASDKVRYVLDKKNNGVFNHMLNTIYNHPRQFLTTLALGNIILLGWIIYLFIEILDPALMTFTLMKKEAVRYFFIIVVISLLTIAANQFIPRMILRKNPDGWIKIFAIPAFLYYILIYPVTRAFIQVSRFLLKIFGCSVKPIQNVILNEKELDSYVKLNIEDIPNDNDVDTDVKIFRNALDFSTKRVKDCMIPRTDIIAVRNDTSTEILKEKFIETGLSRILVFEDNIDNIIGYIHIWELFNDPENWTKKITPLTFVPESMQAKKLMSDLMQQHKNMAVVVDEFGGTSGIVTLEDLVEEIFGDIYDEYDTKSRFLKKENDNEYVLSGRMEIDQVNEILGLDLPESDEYSTIAGMILHYAQRFPKTYETIDIGKFSFKILKVTARKIEVVRLMVNSLKKE
ncbi:MAG: HlyC/CorC family transporter [Dysgonomonadaceae bacterium]|jgi:CBS domain containing-hemolysin-like protein|nr:HlyC/CorC family transporter [Dysgonamonadaceae bacterium]